MEEPDMITRPLRKGDLVEVRSAREILATLDEAGTLDGMPFMPEMVPYCGRQFEVERRVERVCDTFNRAQWSVRMANTLYLDGLRCDGSAHGGCENACRIFWNDAWLRPVGAETPLRHESDDSAVQELLDRAAANTMCSTSSSDVRYSCQATGLPAVSERISATDPRQYVREFTSGNVSLPRFTRVMARAVVMQPLHRLGRLPNPPVAGTSTKTPDTTALGLQPGEWVRVKSRDEIAKTLTDKGKNRGLWFDREMLAFCNRVFRVAKRVNRIIDEQAGTMIELGNDCIMLENVFCSGDRSVGRWFCPRESPPFWRECWLERVEAPADIERQPVGDAPGGATDRPST
jgi:hypothetical protein